MQLFLTKLSVYTGVTAIYYGITPTRPGGLNGRRFHQRRRVVTSNLRCRFYIGRCIDDVNLVPVASSVVGIYTVEVNILRNYPAYLVSNLACKRNTSLIIYNYNYGL